LKIGLTQLLPMKNQAIICLLAGAIALAQVACSPKADQQQAEAAATTATTADRSVATETAAPATSEAATQPAEFAQFQFETQEYNFGTIEQGKKVRYTYKFTNTGKIPLVISQVQPQCGCTAADYTKDPVPPGGKGEIVLEFDSNGKEGQQNKITTVFANIQGGSTILGMTGVVQPLGDGRPLRRN
jgi:nucleoid-associated protein YgaU